jgi:hypothetical protein
MLAGCGSSTTTSPSTAPATTDVASSPAVAPVTSDDPCSVLTAQDLNPVLGTDFADGTEEADDAREIVTCTYTMTDSSTGVEVPVAIVVIGMSLIDGQESFDTNVDLAPAYFGNDSESTEVPGAEKAYIVNNEETQSPVIGMLVGDQFLQIQIGVQGATADQARDLAATAASRIA